MRNCIVWGNEASNSPNVNAVNPAVTYSNIEGGLPGTGNISSFPIFANKFTKDYHLHPASPCIDKGDPTDDYSLEPLPNGGRINMGAYGNTSEATSYAEISVIFDHHIQPTCEPKAQVTFTGMLFGTKGSISVGGATIPASDILVWNDTLIQFLAPSDSIEGNTILLETPTNTDSIPGHYLLTPKVQFVKGEVSGLWSATCPGTYILTGNVNVPTDQSLTIEPGVRVLADLDSSSFANFFVRGNLTALGTKDAPILFSILPYQKESTKVWGGLDLIPGINGKKAQMAYCTVEYASTGIYCEGWASGCESAANNSTIQNCTIRNNRDYGVYCIGHGSSSGCTIPRTGSSSPTIQYNEIYNNGSGLRLSAYDGFLSNGFVGAKINNNLIHHNEHHGIFCDGDDPVNPLIVNNTFFENGDSGIRFRDNFNPNSFRIKNNILVGNQTGILSILDSATTIHNNCVWNNGQDYDGISPDSTNVSNDPLFFNSQNGDFRTKASSICIDTGENGEVSSSMDFVGNNRIEDGDGNGEAIVDIGAIEYQLPTLLAQPDQILDVCEGENILLIVEANGTGLTYQWQKEGLDIPDATNDTLTISGLSLDDAGTYHCIITDELGGNIKTNNFVLVVNQLTELTVEIHASDSIICKNTPVTFEAFGNASSYEWQVNGEVHSEGDSIVTFNDLNDGDTVICIVSSQLACMVNSPDTSNLFEMQVLDLPTIDVEGDQSLCFGDTTTLTASGGVEYLWSTGHASPSITLSPDSTDTLHVEVTDSNGCSNSREVQVGVFDLPSIEFNCLPDTLFDDSPTLLLDCAEPPGGTYTCNGLPCTSFNPSVVGLGEHTVTYTYTSADSCTAEASETIVVEMANTVSDKMQNSQITVFPNPSSGLFTIKTVGMSGSWEISAYDVLGRIVWQMAADFSTNKTLVVDFGQLHNGVYLVSLSQDEKLHSKRVIIQ